MDCQIGVYGMLSRCLEHVKYVFRMCQVGVSIC